MVAKKTKSKTKAIGENVLAPLPSRIALRIPKRTFIVGPIMIAIIALLYFSKGFLVAAVVNGQPIPRFSVIKELEAQGGRQALDSLVVEILIRQEAGKKRIVVSQKELDEEIKKIEESVKSQGQSLDAVLALQKLTKNDVVERIRTQKFLEKLLGDDSKVSDQEITNYLETNKEFFAESLSEEEKKQSAKKQLQQTKLGEKAQKWIEEARKNANIFYFVDY